MVSVARAPDGPASAVPELLLTHQAGDLPGRDWRVAQKRMVGDRHLAAALTGLLMNSARAVT